MILHKMVLLATAFKQRTAAHARQQKWSVAALQDACTDTTRYFVLTLQGACTGTTRPLYEHYKMLVRTLQGALYSHHNKFVHTRCQQNAGRQVAKTNSF